MFPISTGIGSGGGGTTPDLSGYVTSGAMSSALLAYVRINDLATTLNDYPTNSVMNSAIASGASASSFLLSTGNPPHIMASVNDLNKAYVIRHDSTTATPQSLMFDIPWDQSGNGWVAIYNASTVTPLKPYCADSGFTKYGVPSVWNSGVPDSSAIPVGKWAVFIRTDKNSSGVQVDMHDAPVYEMIMS